MMRTAYSPDFFKGLGPVSRDSALTLVPLIRQLLRPTSIVDMGCGTGSWLSVFREEGIRDVLGIDGEWVTNDVLMIPQDQFIRHDLTQPFHFSRKFDLAISVEVAEHLPESAAETFVQSMTQLAPVIAFSAAIPYQGGTHHINEQWQSYWAAQFERHGYVTIDCIRPAIWSNPDVSLWYRQNLLVYVHRDHLAHQSHLQELYAKYPAKQLDVVHPDFIRSMGVRTLWKMMPNALQYTLRERKTRRASQAAPVKELSN